MKSNVLVVVAHPDDEVLGCGGTIARLAKAGHDIYTLILGEGVTARDNTRNRNKRQQEITDLKSEARAANKLLGVREVFFADFPDNRFDTVALLDVIKCVEKIKHETKAQIIFTHHAHDLNVDHQVAYKAVVTATRPLPGEPVKEVYSFEVPSSTEYSFPLKFSPNVFFDISKTLALKQKALEKYKTEIRPFPHPRSVKGIAIHAAAWGLKTGVAYAEPFETVRVLRFS